jgi:dTDP-4-dehydrorhamnose 3,5-epimerase
MQVIRTELEGVLILQPKIFGDQRGYFLESWNRAVFAEAGIVADFVQDNESKSRFGVLRGLHWQAMPYTQAKLVRVISGAVLDITVDIRRGSPTFGQHLAVELSGENKRQMFIPRGFAHGFVVLSEEAVFAYKCDSIYMPSAERGMRPDDPALGIDWRLPAEKWILSEKDRQHPLFKDAEVLEI